MTITYADFRFRFDEVSLGIAVREKRVLQALTQRELGEIVNLAGGTISQIETAENGSSLTINTFLRLCVWLDVSPHMFFTLEKSE